MSRLSSERWWLLPRPDGAVLRRERSGWRKRVFDDYRVRFESPCHGIDEVCQRLIDDLRTLPVAPLAHSGLNFIVADVWTRISVIEGDFRRLTDRQVDLMAEVSLQDLLERPPAAGDYRWQIQPGGKHLFVACLTPGVMTSASRLATELGLNLESVSTHFASAWNDDANPLGRRDSGAFAVVAGSHASVASVSAGILTGITQGSLGDGPDALDRRVDRDLAAWAMDDGPDFKFVLAGSDGQAGPRWKRYGQAKGVGK